jgi:hypothetical protein
MEYLLIDGYNIINYWTDIFKLENEPLEDCRDRLVSMVSNYQGYKKINVIVVFDSHLVKGSRGNKEKFDNITVVYTKENETADNYIERFVHKYGDIYRIRVATSDYLEQTIIFSNGGIRVSPRELRQEIEKVSSSGGKKYSKSNIKTNRLSENIKPELLEILEKMRRGKG